MRRRIVVAGTGFMSALFALMMTGCAAAASETVDYTTSSVTLAPGSTLVVDFGEVNHTVGAEWVITREPDPAVLGPGDADSRYLGEGGEVGAPSEFSYRFAPVGPGTTVIQFEYQFRGAVPDEESDRRNAEITVTVKQ